MMDIRPRYRAFTDPPKSGEPKKPVSKRMNVLKKTKSYILRQKRYFITGFIVIAVSLGVWLLVVNRDSSSSGTGSGQRQIDIAVSKIGRHILLPSGEQPTLATINDVSKYSSVEFFKNATDGDQLLVYAQARQAILYRPSIDKIIAVAPLDPNTTTN
jgi:hypothetical protein